MKPVVLVTALGTMASTTIVAQLRKTKAYYIIGADINQANQIASSRDVDEFTVFPPSIENLDAYMDFVLDFCEKKHVQYYFATIDEEIVNLSRNRKRFEDIGVRLCIPNHDLVMTCHYKNVFNDWIKQNFGDLSIKTYRDLDAIPEGDFPIFIKPIEGRASIGCRKIENRNELAMLEVDLQLGEYIVQEFVSGEIVTVDMVRNARSGQHRQIQRLETLRNGNGCGIAVEIIHDEKLEAFCSALMLRLDLNGVINAEFFRVGDAYKIIEVNPRFSAGTSFSCMAGCNTVLEALRIADGAPDLLPSSIQYGKHFAKRYETYLMD